jgi:large subunit ribosomal protein L23
MSLGLDARQILLAPVVSEKSYSLIEVGKYSFRVHPDAHKTQVRQAVEELFDVQVVGVNIVKVKAKPKRRGAHRGTKPGWKKAIVQLAEGEKIEIFEGAGVV